VRIPPLVEARPDAVDCAGTEPFALMVLGDDMRPEFEHGDVIVVEPGGLAQHGSFVVARCGGEWRLRQLRAADGGWRLATLEGPEPPTAIDGLGVVAGVVIQKCKPGRRRAGKRYVE